MMRAWTVHPPRVQPAPASVPGTGVPPAGRQAKPSRSGLVLVPERFSCLAALLPAVWLLMHRLWWPLIGYLVFATAIVLLLPGPLAAFAGIAAQWLIGLHAQDLRRWQLARQGRPAAAVVLGKDEPTALMRALEGRPDWAAMEAGGRAA